LLYGITYIDFRTRCVFNGSDVGKEYSAKGLLEKCTIQNKDPAVQRMQLSREIGDDRFEHSKNLQQGILKTIDELMKPEMNQNASEPE
jgi:hypothetical protein